MVSRENAVTLRIVEVHQRDQVETFTETDTLTCGAVLPGFTLTVQAVFDLE